MPKVRQYLILNCLLKKRWASPSIF